jgi:uncharacterized protein YndB with AHSA1/START domain
MTNFRNLLVLVLACLALPAAAEVTQSDTGSFTVTHRLIVPVSDDVAYDEVLHPERWWSSEHTWSKDAKNLSLDPKAGGCWCERWADGEVEHARVVHLSKNKLLRIVGGFGPLQSMPVNAVMEFAITAGKDGSQIELTYRVAGPSSAALDKIASGVDEVLGMQLERLHARLVTLGPPPPKSP